MELKPIKTYTKQELFIQEVEKWIFEGKIKPGEKLPSEREMASKMCISRSVINRGLQELSRLKLIKINPQSGCVVNNYFQVGNLETLNALLDYQDGNYSQKLLYSIYDARKLVEKEIIVLASERCSKVDGAKLNNLIDDFISSNSGEKGELLFKFFHQLAIISNNQIYPLLISSFRPVYQILGKWNSENQGWHKVVSFNRKLINAIAAHQTDKALQYYSELVNWSLQDLLR